jgi:Tfp pilus assembly protein PilF
MTKARADEFLRQGWTVRAAAVYMKLVETDPSVENLNGLADVYMQQGLFEDAKALYLKAVILGIQATR